MEQTEQQNCCELLAFILYLCSLKQRQTEEGHGDDRCELLAFILYLCSLKQPALSSHLSTVGCELLAFILYLCSLKQLMVTKLFLGLVVNCLHLSCIFAL